jgi:hypothetical protein
MPETTTARLREALLSIPPASSADDGQEVTRILRQALLDFGSETDDNVAALDKIAVGRVEKSTGRDGWGLRLATRALPLSTILNSAEVSPVPEQVRAAHPSLTQEEWDAVLRVPCLAFCPSRENQPANMTLTLTATSLPSVARRATA